VNMPERPPNDNTAKPPARDVLREARRLARLRHLHVVPAEPQLLRGGTLPDPKEAA